MKKIIYALLLIGMLSFAACGGSEDAANDNNQMEIQKTETKKEKEETPENSGTDSKQKEEKKQETETKQEDTKDTEEVKPKAETLSERLDKYPHYSVQEDFSHDDEYQEILDAGFGGIHVYVPEEEYISKKTDYYTIFKINDISYTYDIRLISDDVPMILGEYVEFAGNYCLATEEETDGKYTGIQYYVYNLSNQKLFWMSFRIADSKNKATTAEERKEFANQITESLKLSIREMASVDGSEWAASEQSLKDLENAYFRKEIAFEENNESYKYLQKFGDLEICIPLPLAATKFTPVDRNIYGFGQYQNTQVSLYCFGLEWEQDILESEVANANETVSGKDDRYVMCVIRNMKNGSGEKTENVRITVTNKENGATIWLFVNASNVGNTIGTEQVEYIDAVIESIKACLDK